MATAVEQADLVRKLRASVSAYEDQIEQALRATAAPGEQEAST
jgi:hypothetical protein